MEPTPLIPTSFSKVNPDTSQILREVFQDLLETESFPKNVAQNLTKFNAENKELKNVGIDVSQAYEKLKINIEDIEDAEREVMKSQAIFMENKIFEGKLPNAKLCTYPRIYPNLDKRITNKYSLLQADDLLPTVPERVLDIKYNKGKSKCPTFCPKTEEHFLKGKEFPFLKTDLPPDYDEKFKKLKASPSKKKIARRRVAPKRIISQGTKLRRLLHRMR